MRIRIYLFILMVFSPSFLFPSVYYEAGDLINVVKRNQAITDFFLERWKIMKNSLSFSNFEEKTLDEKYYHLARGSLAEYFDFYFRGEIIPNYPVMTPYGRSDLNLYKFFASTTLKFEDLIQTDYFSWGLALNLSGFRYGMSKEVNLKNDTSGLAETPSVVFDTREYVYNQIFDDLFVLSNIFKPFGTLHTGILFNKELDPGNDGLLNTGDDIKVNSYSRLFFNIELFALSFNLGYNSKKEKTDFFNSKLEVFDLLKITTDWIQNREALPDFYIGYTYFNPQIRNLEPYRTVLFEVFYNIENIFNIKAQTEVFAGKSRSLIQRENPYKQLLLEIDWGLFKRNPDKTQVDRLSSLYLIFGFSQFTDARLLLYGSEKPKTGGFAAGLKFNFIIGRVGGSLQVKVSKNYAPKLYQLIESYDRWIAECSVQLNF
ncbi:MAG: hypothetical protein A2Y41_12555 [Spirochaetes bacterium GWB1_36_13]|nr:MAG: hypothetical protein A2Y41_12555 [Spirochaetes bacterium GWB1_36_13]